MTCISEAELRRALGGPVQWPDADARPYASALLARIVYTRLAEAYGEQHAFLADMLGTIGDHDTDAGFRAGMAVLHRWNAAQLGAGEPQGIRALTAAAKTEAQTHATKTTA